MQTAKLKKSYISKIIDEKLWINFDAVESYYFTDGVANETLDHEFKNIGTSNIDDVSIKIADEYESLLDLKYN